MSLDSAYKWMVIVGTALAIVAAPVTAAWVIANSMSGLGTRITVLEGKVDAVGEKIDWIIEDLDIRVEAIEQ